MLNELNLQIIGIVFPKPIMTMSHFKLSKGFQVFFSISATKTFDWFQTLSPPQTKFIISSSSTHLSFFFNRTSPFLSCEGRLCWRQKGHPSWRRHWHSRDRLRGWNARTGCAAEGAPIPRVEKKMEHLVRKQEVNFLVMLNARVL